jgi:hypothetical protein
MCQGDGEHSPEPVGMPEEIAIELKCKLHMAMTGMSRRQQIELLYSLGTFVAARLEKLRPPVARQLP